MCESLLLLWVFFDGGSVHLHQRLAIICHDKGMAYQLLDLSTQPKLLVGFVRLICLVFVSPYYVSLRSEFCVVMSVTTLTWTRYSVVRLCLQLLCGRARVLFYIFVFACVVSNIYCVAFSFCFSLSCVSCGCVASFSGLSILDFPCSIL